MRIKYLFFILSVLTIFMSIALLQKAEQPLKIITSPNIYSYQQTSSIETVPIMILMNQYDNYYVDQDFVTKIELVGTDEIYPLLLKDIVISDIQYTYNDTPYYEVNFIVEVGFSSSDYLISMQQASLHVTYQTEEEFEVYIGEFYYVFDESTKHDLTMGNFKATVMDYQGVKTVSGINIELYNETYENILIHEIQLYSSSVKINNDYSIKLYQEIDMFETVENVLLKQYSSNSIQINPKEIIVRTNDSVSIYVPLSFLDDIHFIHRACMYIRYEKNGEMYTMTIDDFPFINTSIFQVEYQDNFRYYEYPN